MPAYVRRLVTSAALAIALTGAAAVTAAPAQAAAPPVGTVVCHAGRASGLQCGVVTTVNATIHAGGTISGVFLYTACAQPGNGRAPIYRPSTGVRAGTVLGTVGPLPHGGPSGLTPSRPRCCGIRPVGRLDAG